VTAFAHGGDVVSFAKIAGCSVNEVVDLSSNINFVKPKIDVDFNALNILAYPNYEKLFGAIAKLYGIEPSQMELYNGGSSAIFSLFRTLGLKQCTLYAPAYLEYKRAAMLFGYELTLINRFSDITKEPKENSLVVFVNPSTPDGAFYEIEAFMQMWKEKNCTLLVDESFLEFTPYESVLKYLKEYDKLYILKSMTKFYGAAGIRVGAIISDASNIEKLRENEPMWKISEFDSHYIQSVLKDDTFALRSKLAHDENREILLNILNRTKYIKRVYPSSANYILVKLDGITAKEFQLQLISYRIMIRDCQNFDGLDEYYVRIAIKTERDLGVFAEALKSIELW